MITTFCTEKRNRKTASFLEDPSSLWLLSTAENTRQKLTPKIADLMPNTIASWNLLETVVQQSLCYSLILSTYTEKNNVLNLNHGINL